MTTAALAGNRRPRAMRRRQSHMLWCWRELGDSMGALDLLVFARLEWRRMQRELHKRRRARIRRRGWA